MAKRLSEKQKEEIIRSFTEGEDVESLSEKFNCNKLTITRNLKKQLGEIIYKDLIKKNKSRKDSAKDLEKVNKDFSEEFIYEESSDKKEINQDSLNEDSFNFNSFTEIAPLNQEIDNKPRKDLSSVPISDINFPKIVYMIVDTKIELETKLLKEYPEWQFLSKNELNRKTIEIYFDLKIAKRFCNSDQKVIKIPNTKVFEIVAPILVSRGISRIISEKNLIAL